jgi:iron complex transport system substrate-binding protein
VYEVFTDVLNHLQPTHIITQTHCRVCAVSLEDVEQALSAGIASRPKLVSLEPNSLADISADVRRVADACGFPGRGDQVVRALEAGMTAVSETCHRDRRRPRVTCIEWIEPLMAAGNWVPELVSMANGENVFGEAGLHSPGLSWEQLLAADPDVLLISPCGFDLERTRREMYWLSGRPEWADLAAVRNEQVYLIDGNQYMNRPGPRVADSLRIIGGLLHPDLFPPGLQHAYERASTPHPKN